MCTGFAMVVLHVYRWYCAAVGLSVLLHVAMSSRIGSRWALQGARCTVVASIVLGLSSARAWMGR
jgi:hypothetical protein